MIKKLLKWTVVTISTLSLCVATVIIMAIITDTEDKSIHQQTNAEKPIKTELERKRDNLRYLNKDDQPLIFEGEYDLDFLELYNEE
ncbi:hypothetical protein [Gracilibacillus kekensis]|uniref:Uncharacterized protein n=1 Tax=Gracilibacillus kekensis TaxID=1027249 RepID=A0A1M7K414_9BACI|nr:hypothetical protein [Gracilibacillus kekensis]SHM59955.1 hypothetical protein SAMN05216179_0567 [Gracilibacillus kekensis]